MDPLTQNQNPITNGSQLPPQMPAPEPEHSGMGPIAGAVIVIVLLVAGGLYFYGAKLNQEAMMKAIPNMPQETMMEDGTLTETSGDAMVGLPSQSSSDDASSIEADLNAMDIGAIESSNQAELNNL